MNRFTLCKNGVIADTVFYNRMQCADTESVLLLSDTHGAIDAVRWILSTFSGECRTCLFAGDGAQDMITLAREAASGAITVPPNIIMAQGNCDCPQNPPVFAEDKAEKFFRIPVYQQQNIAGHRILLTHGHLNRIELDGSRLCFMAENFGCTIAVHGHTHVQSIEYLGSVTIINPGSPLCPRGKSYGGFAILSINNTHHTNGGAAEPAVPVQSCGTLRFYKLVQENGGGFSAAVHTEYPIQIVQPSV